MSVDMEQTADRPAQGGPEPLVRVTGVKKYFPITQGIIFQREVGRVHAVDGVDLAVSPARRSGSWARPAAASPPWPA